MRSLIKMQMTKYPTFDVVPINELPFKEEELKYSGIATHQSARPNTRIYASNSANKATISYYDSNDTIEVRQNEKKKRNIEKYISDLTCQIENPRQEADFGDSKFKVLKRIIEHYDIKNMEKKHYSKLIKAFGLEIEPIKSQRQQIRTQHNSRSFKIRSSARGETRLSKLQNIALKQGQEQSEIAIMQFSKQLEPRKEAATIESDRKNKSFSERLQSRYKQKVKLKIKKIQPRQNSPSKKQTHFKFKSSQDITVDKINKFRQFLYLLNLSNNLYRDLCIDNYQFSLKYFVGPGNNSNLIRALMKKRFYFQETIKISQANFVWTQIKDDKVFLSQPRAEPVLEHSRQKTRNTRTKMGSNSQLHENLQRILTQAECYDVLRQMQELSRKLTQPSFQQRLRYTTRRVEIKQISPEDRIHNHLPSNGLLGNKKGMMYCLREYYKLTGKNIWTILPLTFHISKGLADPEFKNFIAYYNQRKKSKQINSWIMKPGEFSNRGNGISCSNKLDQIKKRASKCSASKNGQARTLILQLYLSNPLLYNNRKFDIRAYALVTCHNGKLKGYWYQEGYIRTSSYPFDMNELAENDIHLTNDAIQKQSEAYGKFEPGNKLSYAELQRYIESLQPCGRVLDFHAVVLPQMKAIAGEALKSSFMFLDQHRKQNNFEIFGLDFMIDWDLKPWLIEINTNPCLELSCPLLERIIPHMVENALRIGLDPVFPPPHAVPHNYKYTIAENALHYNKFELIFDEDREGPPLRKLYEAYPGSVALVGSLAGIREDQELYKQQGQIQQFDL